MEVSWAREGTCGNLKCVEYEESQERGGEGRPMCRFQVREGVGWSKL